MVTENQLLSKSIELISNAEEEGIKLRMFGGLAVAYLAPNGRAMKELYRESNDIDLYSLSAHLPKLDSFMERNGIQPDSKFNALYGLARRQYFYGETKVDLILDEFRMCHRIQLYNRVPMSKITIPPSDLLLTKLQIFEMNEKDIKDVLALLYEMRMGNSDTHTSIDSGYISKLLSKDWGIYRTVTMNLEKVNSHMESLGLNPKKRKKISAEIEYLRNAIELRPKSLSWKLRAKVGDKVKWYELPEEVDYVVPAAAPSAELSLEENGTRYEWLSFSEMDRIAADMASQIKSKYGKPRSILYIERGGMVLAKMLSDLLGVNEVYGLQIVAYESVNKMGQGMYILPHYISLEPKKEGYVLLVDDIADSGKTIKAAKELFTKRYGELVTATMVYKKRSVVKPDIVGKVVPDNNWIVFGYETNENENDFKKAHVYKGMEFLDAARKQKQGGFEDVRTKAESLSKKLLNSEGSPAAILYISTTGLVAARLLSDYLGTRRVSSIIPRLYVEGDYVQHVYNVCSRALEGNKNGYVLLVDTVPAKIAEIRESLSWRFKDIRIVTASLSGKKQKGIDFTA